ncbi:MAG TPA: amidohydrolase family protein [Phycisphaerales bacterium]|nr:amidohydrolase family protein [Phycisphaerales bacterium]
MAERPAGMAMREAHGHLGMLGESLRQPSLQGCASVGECLERLREAASGVGPGGWLLVRGARTEGWAERRWPTLAELDGATRSVPTVVMSFDHHTAVANSAALAGAGLRAGVPVPPNGLVCADGMGTATGVLMEQAAVVAWGAAPEVGFDERVEQVRAGAAHLAGLGFVEVHDLHTPEWMGPALAVLEDRGELPLRVRLYPAFDRIEAEAARAAEYERGGAGLVSLAGGKLFADGTLNSQTALVLAPYAGGRNHGTAMHTHGEIVRAIERCDAVGKHLAVHAIGDGAVRLVLDAFEQARPRTPGGRIEHCELVDGADVGRFKRLGVVCSVQPCHLLADVEVLKRTLPHALQRVLPLRDLLASGLEPGDAERGLVFGSDVPIVRADPEDSVRAAVERRRPGMAADEAINASQAISVEQAWRCFACTG